MGDKFYVSPTHLRCSVHDKPATHQVKAHVGGALYRHACSEKCANEQKAELEKAWADSKEVR